MATKMIKKSELRYDNGYLSLEDGTVVTPANDMVVVAYNRLEIAVQKQNFARKNGLFEDKPEPVTTDDFVPKSEWEVPTPSVKVETPSLDAKVEESMKIVDELDMLENADKANKLIERMEPLFEWAFSDMVMVKDEGCKLRFNGLNMPSPLNITPDGITERCVFAATGKFVQDGSEDKAEAEDDE